MEQKPCFFRCLDQHLDSFKQIDDSKVNFKFSFMPCSNAIVYSYWPLREVAFHQLVYLIRVPFPSCLFQLVDFKHQQLESQHPYQMVVSFQAPNSISSLFHFTESMPSFESYLAFIQLDLARKEHLNSLHCLDWLKMASLNELSHVIESIILTITLLLQFTFISSFLAS